MGLRINQNVEAMNSYRHLSETNNAMATRAIRRLVMASFLWVEVVAIV